MNTDLKSHHSLVIKFPVSSLNTCYKILLEQLIITEIRGKFSVITQLFTKNVPPNSVLNEFNMVTLQPDALEQAAILPKPLFNHLLYIAGWAQKATLARRQFLTLFPPLISNPRFVHESSLAITSRDI
jgi:hypothetical protein